MNLRPLSIVRPLPPLHAARLLVRAMRALGDLPGHEFHGNQYTGVGGVSHGPSLEVARGPINFKDIGHRRFMFEPRRGTVILGKHLIDKDLSVGSHASEFDLAKEKDASLASYDAYVRGWVDAPEDGDAGSIEIYLTDSKAWPGGKENADAAAYDAVIKTVQRFIAGGASRDTHITIEPVRGGQFVPGLITRSDDATLGETFPELFRKRRALGDLPGHEFHGNQWTTGQGGRAGYDTPQHEVYPSQIADMTRSLHAAAKKLDFPPEKIIIKPYERGFSVGGRSFTEGGHFDPVDGTITMNANSLAKTSSTDAETMLAHEVMHRDWHDVSRALDLERGSTSVDVGELPEARVIRETLFQERDVLMREDGVSDYSRAYWKEVPQEPQKPRLEPFEDLLTEGEKYTWENSDTHELYTDKEKQALERDYKLRKTQWDDAFQDDEFVDQYEKTFRTAVNETLAEIARRELQRAFTFVHPVGDFDPTPRWRKLYDAVKKTAKVVRERQSAKGNVK